MSDRCFLSITILGLNARFSVKNLHLALKYCIFAVNKITNKNMKITIINTERNEKRYTRVELEEFVAQLSDGTYRQQYIREFNKEVCFAAEWVKQNGELKAPTLLYRARWSFTPHRMPVHHCSPRPGR